MKFILFCLWEPKEGEEQSWDVMKSGSKILNNGKPWLCSDDANGLTGFVGLQVEAENEQEAKEKMIAVIADYKRRDKEPNTWR